ncbi:MAG: hypothetical protein SLAVMIC_00424 [uncultured marine phage]|uniref:Uncharacterized protein n=1 Tax=uncultured marine phage TaxID=707152 RepID=A0A8D9C8X0_9VIRU|nr:MAG: hypothetical protein SLAVMIC_00424 [uncultured marine phage]
MELFSYYNLSESVNAELVLDKLENLSSELKIDYSYNSTKEVFKIVDLDLTIDELQQLKKIFDDNEVLPDFDAGDMEDYNDLYGFDDEDYDF